MRHFIQIPFQNMAAAENMAMDAGMLAWSGQTGVACFRIYGWKQPAHTFGYSQAWKMVTGVLGDRPGVAIRRMTGGGIVDHRHDLTYAIAIPATHRWHRIPAPKLYRELHQLIRKILNQAGFDTALAPCDRDCHTRPGVIALACFTGAEPDDLVNSRTGRKVGGAAMKRTRAGLLVQGSLSRNELPGLNVLSFEQELGRHLAAALGGKLQLAAPDSSKISKENQERFASAAWNQRR